MTNTITEEQTPIHQLAPTETAMTAAEPACLRRECDRQAAGAVFEIPTPAPLCARVTAIQSLHLRDQPDERARVIGYLHNREQVRVIAYGPWWKINTREGTGYANARYLELTECEL